MNKKIGVILIGYSLLLAGLSFVVHYSASASAWGTLAAGLAGGVLCLIWGLRAVAGSRGKALPILTLIPVSFVLLGQTFTSWSGGAMGRQGAPLKGVLTTLLLVLSLGVLVRIAWSGVVFDLPSVNPAKDATGKAQPTGRLEAQTGASKHS